MLDEATEPGPLALGSSEVLGAMDEAQLRAKFASDASFIQCHAKTKSGKRCRRFCGMQIMDFSEWAEVYKERPRCWVHTHFLNR